MEVQLAEKRSVICLVAKFRVFREKQPCWQVHWLHISPTRFFVSHLSDEFSSACGLLVVG